jgi:hypothetical protein
VLVAGAGAVVVVVVDDIDGVSDGVIDNVGVAVDD